MEFLSSKSSAKAFTRPTSKEVEQYEGRERKRSLLYLMEAYMRDMCLHDAADALAAEAQLTNQYELCDNVDLDMILLDYNAYYHMRFDKYPKILRRCSATGVGTPPTKEGKRSDARKASSKSGSPAARKASCQTMPTAATSSTTSTKVELHIGVTTLSPNKKVECEGASPSMAERKVADEERDLPALCDFEGYSSEWREMAELIAREIVTKARAPRLAWADCVGLECGAQLLREAVVYPRRRPEWFAGLLAPWRGVLLYGPPGTGKTLLARALAAQGEATFINVTISTFVSKWRGESEKMLKVLFDVARLYAPTTVFIDELDAIAGRHEEHQHEASRRFRSELLIQLDGLLHADGGNVFVLAATNAPWNLCGAVLRRFDKRILVNVPTAAGRDALYRYYLGKYPANNFGQSDYQAMSAASEHFSGADIKLACREAAMCALREKLSEIDAPDGGTNPDARAASTLRALTMQDVRLALGKMRPTSDAAAINKYVEWERHYCRT